MVTGRLISLHLTARLAAVRTGLRRFAAPSLLTALVALSACAPEAVAPQARVGKAAELIAATELARWEERAANVTIKRDR